jgi:GDP-L-fucose synthase
MDKNNKVFVAVHEGMIGSAILDRLKQQGYRKLVTRTYLDLDLTDQEAVGQFFSREKPDYVFLPSSMMGGIQTNSRHPAEFIYTNLMSQVNVIHSAWKSGVKKLLFLGSNCIYPKNSPQPMKEEYLLTGVLESTSEAYSIAKIAGIKMCQSYNRQYGARFISVVPSDIYGPGDDFNPETGHVQSALMSKMHKARVNNEPSVIVWGTGSPRRDCLYVDDLADACIFLMDKYDDSEMINVGSGIDTSITELAVLIKQVVGFKGEIVYDKLQPDGTPRKLMDSSKLSKMGWSPQVSLERGLTQTYEWYKKQMPEGPVREKVGL